MGTSLGDLTVDEYNRQLELNDSSSIKREAFQVAYESVVDQVLRHVDGDDEEVPDDEAFVVGPAWEVYQAEIVKKSKSKESGVKVGMDRAPEKLADSSREVSEPTVTPQFDISVGAGEWHNHERD